MGIIRFTEDITFSAAHYIPGHPTCGCIHGHTYFVKDLRIEVKEAINSMGISVDFGTIKKYFKSRWDHKFIVPLEYYKYWNNILDANQLNCDSSNLVPLEFTTCEWMAAMMVRDLTSLVMDQIGDVWDDEDRVPTITFTLCEGPKQGFDISE